MVEVTMPPRFPRLTIDLALLVNGMPPLHQCSCNYDEVCVVSAYFDEDVFVGLASPELLRFSDRNTSIASAYVRTVPSTCP